MLPELGLLSLLIALVLAVLLGTLPLIGAQRGNAALMATARPLAFSQLVFIGVAFVVLAHAFLVHDFSVAYVAQNSNSLLPDIYQFTAVWGAHEGSLLLWVLILSLWIAAVALFSRALPQPVLARVLAVMGWISVGFLAFLVFTSNPFERLLPMAAEGRDLNPLLQDPGMIVHPPLLYTGYVGFAVAFAFAIAALIDGKLDDAAWSAATPITQFTQFNPDEGLPPTQRTVVRILYDDEALYIGATMFDTEGPNGISTRLVRRDNEFDSDYFQIVIDGYHDHLSRAMFTVNPSGSKQDQIGTGASCCDSGWDPVWQVESRVNADGWVAEIRIPFSQLRYASDSVQTWGLQLRRWIQRRQEEDTWSFWKRSESGGAQRFGHLEGLRIPHTGRHLELLPYVASTARAVQADKQDPFNYGVKSAR